MRHSEVCILVCRSSTSHWHASLLRACLLVLRLCWFRDLLYSGSVLHGTGHAYWDKNLLSSKRVSRSCASLLIWPNLLLASTLPSGLPTGEGTKAANDSKLLVYGVTFIPPLLITLFYPQIFVSALSYAGILMIKFHPFNCFPRPQMSPFFRASLVNFVKPAFCPL